MSIKIDVDGWDFTEALDRATLQAVRERTEAFDKIIKEAAREAIDAKLAAITEELLRAEVTAILQAGWARTDNYGEPLPGPPLTLRSRALEYLTKKDTYSHKTVVDEVFREEMQKALKGELGEALAEATAKLRALVDGQITEKMRDVLKGLFR